VLKIDKIQVQAGQISLPKLPNWAKSMLRAGWWMRKFYGNGVRLFMPILVPERGCCSVFCSLGSLLKSMTNDARIISWEELSELQENSTIYFVWNGAPMEGVVGGYIEVDGKHGRQISIVSKIKKYKGSSISILPDYIHNYHISLTPHTITKRHLKQLNKLAKFYAVVDEDFNEACVDKNDVETLIISNKAEWNRQNQDIYLSCNGSKELIQITQLLMQNDNTQSGPSRTLLQSPRSVNPIDAPLVILDGSDSIQSWRHFPNSNIIFLLSHSEYDQEASDTFTMMAGYNDDSLVPDDFPEDFGFPEGCESMLMTVQQ
jgi:hypothetical protein